MQWFPIDSSWYVMVRSFLIKEEMLRPPYWERETLTPFSSWFCINIVAVGLFRSPPNSSLTQNSSRTPNSSLIHRLITHLKTHHSTPNSLIDIKSNYTTKLGTKDDLQLIWALGESPKLTGKHVSICVWFQWEETNPRPIELQRDRASWGPTSVTHLTLNYPHNVALQFALFRFLLLNSASPSQRYHTLLWSVSLSHVRFPLSGRSGLPFLSDHKPLTERENVGYLWKQSSTGVIWSSSYSDEDRVLLVDD